MSDNAQPTAPKRTTRKIVHAIWRYGFITFAWYLTKMLVWMRFHLRLPRWLGGDAREMAMRLWNLSWLTFVWVLLWGTVTWANIITGMVVAVLITVLLPLPRVPIEGRMHIAPLAILAVRLVIDLCHSSIQVAWLAIRPGRGPMSAVLRTRLALKSDLVLTLAVDYINLVPGTMVLEIDHQRRLLYVHLIDVSSDKSVQSFYRQMASIEKLFIKAFERESEWHASPYHGIDNEVDVKQLPQGGAS